MYTLYQKYYINAFMYIQLINCTRRFIFRNDGWLMFVHVFLSNNTLFLYADLAARLQELKKDDETIDGFGKAMKDWVRHCINS